MAALNLDGKDWMVSAEWAAAVERELGTLTFSTRFLESEAKAIGDEANRISPRDIGPKKRRRSDYIRHVLNVRDTIQVVGDHHDPREWGLDGWDAVHGQGWRPGCGCFVHHIIDHHQVFNHFGHNRVVPAHARQMNVIEPLAVCEAHAHLAKDPQAHLAALK